MVVLLIGADGLLGRGGEHHRLILLEAEQILTAAAQQQAIGQRQGAISQGRQEAFAAAMQLEHIHIKTALQSAGMQRLADQLRTKRDLHLGEVATAGEGSDQIVVVVAVIRQQAIGQQQHHRTTHQPHPDSDRREAE